MAIFRSKEEIEGWMALPEDLMAETLAAVIAADREHRENHLRLKARYAAAKERVAEMEKKYPQYQWARSPRVYVGARWWKKEDSGKRVWVADEEVPAEYREAVLEMLEIGHQF